MKKNGVVATMAEIAIFSALGYVLDTVASLYSKPLFLNGGSIGIAMACIFFIAFRRGLLPGLATGLILGLLQLVNGVYVAPIADTWWKAFAQIALDYWLAYPVVGFAGLLHHLFSKGSSKKVQLIALISGCVLGGLLKFLCHFLSGVIFWPDDAWNVGSSALYSFLYNGAYTFPSIILSTALVVVLSLRLPHYFMPENRGLVASKESESRSETIGDAPVSKPEDPKAK